MTVGVAGSISIAAPSAGPPRDALARAGWGIAHGRPELSNGAVHLWFARVADLPSPPRRALEATLAPDEMARADRFRRSRDRDRFIAAHGLLREVLGGYLRTDPAALRFRSGRWGKPELETGSAGGQIQFNVAYADYAVLIGVARGRAIGVDLELVRPTVSALELAERICSARELTVLRALPADARPWGFFRLWTAKEAVLKADGRGLWVDPMRVDVSDVMAAPTVRAQRRIRVEAGPSWAIQPFALGGAYAAALAVAGDAPAITLRRLGGTTGPEMGR